jgi:hypothetical protein
MVTALNLLNESCQRFSELLTLTITNGSPKNLIVFDIYLIR